MTKQEHDTLVREFVDRGKIIEAGFIGLQFAAMPPDSPPSQVREMRMAFFAGAQHLFGSILGILEPDAEPTEKDLRRMDLINKELNQFIEQFKENHLKGTQPHGKPN